MTVPRRPRRARAARWPAGPYIKTGDAESDDGGWYDSAVENCDAAAAGGESRPRRVSTFLHDDGRDAMDDW